MLEYLLNLLKNGNFFVSGNTWGKVRAMINDEGKFIDLATPSTPVEILGMNKSALAGDDFIVVESENKAKEINDLGSEKIKKLVGCMTYGYPQGS